MSYLGCTRSIQRTFPLRFISTSHPRPSIIHFYNLRINPTAKMSTNNNNNGIEQISTTSSAAPAAPYSQGIKANGQIWVSGQVHFDQDGNRVEGSVGEKTAQCCRNVKAILEAAGSGIDKIVRVGVFLVDMKDFPEMNEEYKKWFPLKPARACVAVHQLPLGCTVEIEAIALA